MSFDGPRYKRFHVCKRKSEAAIPSCVLHVKTIDSFQTLSSNGTYCTELTSLSALSCQFCPNDSRVFCSLGVFEMYTRENATISSGFVSVWDIEAYDEDCIDEGDLEGMACFFTYSPFPYPVFSSCGNLITAVMNSYQGNLSLAGFTYDVDDLDYKQYDTVTMKCHGGNLIGKTFCCVINDRFAVSITDRLESGNILPCEFTVWKVSSQSFVDGMTLKHYWTRTMFGIFAESNSSIGIGNSRVKECLFSPDGNSIGLLFSTNIFVLVCVEQRTAERVIDLKALIGTMDDSVSIPSFCFHPLFLKRYIAFACDTKCYVADIFAPAETYHCIACIPEEDRGTVNHVTYSRDGRFFSMSTSSLDAAVYVFNAKRKYRLLYKLPFDYQANIALSTVVANQSNFSWTSEELLVAYSDGSVRVWQLSRVIGLKELCRVRCLCLFPRHVIENSSFIPKQMKNYLFFVPQLD